VVIIGLMGERRPGRPQEFAERITKAVRLDAELDSRLKAEASARGVSANLLINAAVKDYLNRLVPISDVLRTAS
jgi:predicted HicB family RNase H-like nuclease